MADGLQIGGYVTKAEKALFKAYSESCGIAESALANLLVRRELSLNRLAILGRLHSSEAKKGPRITANIKEERIKTAFKEHVKRYDMEPGPAATVLWRAELAEQWMDAAISRESS